MHCETCKRFFDDSLRRDCGGDCLLCVAEAGDTDCALEAVRLLKARLCAAEGVLRDAVPYAEWCDKHIYPVEGETHQNWLLQIYLPVPLDEADKSPGAALDRLLQGATK